MAPTPTTIFIINSPDAPAHLAANFGLDPGKTWTVDATGISLAELGKNIPNTPMLGALAKVSGLVGIDQLEESVKKGFGKKFCPGDHRSQRQGGATRLRGGEDGMSELKGWRKLPIGGIILEEGSSRDYHTGGWRTFRPVFHEENCIHCLFC